MAFSTKTLKTRMRAIKNTKKITKAMELVAASKMRKAVQCVIASRSYSHAAWEILQRVREKTDPMGHTLLRIQSGLERVLVVLFTSNRGLCGSYNTQIIQRTRKDLQSMGTQENVDFVIVGKKGKDMHYKFGQHVVAEFIKEDVITDIVQMQPISHFILQEYLHDAYNAVLLAYTDFVSPLQQVPRIRRILPITRKDEYIGELEPSPLVAPPAGGNDTPRTPLKGGISQATVTGEFTAHGDEYLFEPSADIVLEELLPRLISVQMYQAYLEANASEHASRMIAMRNAAQAASDIIEDLTLTFHQARQTAITREIAEISAGKAVLSR